MKRLLLTLLLALSIGVGAAWAQTYELVTSTTENGVEVGSNYLIVMSKSINTYGVYTWAMSSTQATNNRPGVEVALQDNSIVITNEEAAVITIAASENTNYPYYLTVTDENSETGYLYSNDSKK